MMRFVENPKDQPAVKAFVDAAERGTAPPPLYATLKRDFSGRGKDGHAKLLLKGQRVRITDVGRFGDIGATTDLDEPKRDEVRVTWKEMSDYSDKP